MLGLLWLLFHRTRWGTLVRAATQDREMVAALGVNQNWLFTGVLPRRRSSPGSAARCRSRARRSPCTMDLSIIAEAFVVVVVGGMGSVAGAFLAALLIAELNAFGILVFPQITLVI